MLCKSRSFKDVVLTKRKIRAKILLRLNSQKEEDQEKKSKIIKEKLFRQSAFKKAKRIMFYISLDGEVDTASMIQEAQKLGKIIAVPVCKRNSIMLRPAILKLGARLKMGPYGVSEPAIKRFINLKDLDLVVVPGLAFDKKGNRLGRGKGCYDFFLKKLSKKTISIGLAFNFQILPTLPTTKRDISVDKVLFA